MKIMTNYTRLLLLLFLTVFVSAKMNNLHAQSCNQIEILYTSPECFNEKGSDEPAGGQGRGCKPIAVCRNQNYTYSSSGTGTGWVYGWNTTGPTAVFISPSTTSSTINISWPQVGSYTLTHTATDPSGNVFTSCLTVNVKDKPIANFTFSPNNVCAGSTISFTNTTTFSGGVAYSWNFDDPLSGSNNFSTTTNPTHTYNNPGVYNVTLIAYSFSTVLAPSQNGEAAAAIKTCCADTIKKVVTITPGTLTIECVSTVCAGDTVTYNAVGCSGVIWLPPVGGSMVNQTPTSITIQWGNGNLQGQIQAQCPGGCIASVPVPIIPITPIIIGNTTPCNTLTNSYTLSVLPGTFYTWTLTNTTNNTNHNSLLNTYPDNNTVWINWALAPPGTYQLAIHLDNKHICCNSNGSLTITPTGKWTGYFDQTICVNTTANLAVAPGGGTFNWTVLLPNAGVAPLSGSGSSFNPLFTIAGDYTVQVIETANTYCNSGASNPQQIKIKVINIATPGIINGPVVACAGSNNTYTMSTPAPTGYHYKWNITGGAGTFQPGNLTNVNGNSVTINWTALTGTISVVLAANGFPPCPSPAVTLNVTQAFAGTITGTMNVCVDGTGTYTLSGLPAGTPVNWAISPSSQGTISSPPGLNPVTILWHGTTSSGPWPASISATTGCGSPPALTGIMVSPKFSVTISQTGIDICQPGGVTLSAAGAPLGASYIWSPGGQTTQSINVTTPGFYSVTSTKSGCFFTSLPFEVEDPFLILPITCGFGFCNGTATNEVLSVAVIKPFTGTFTYQWYNGIYPAGTSISGANSPNYTTTTHGNYYVIVTYNSCTRYSNFTVQKVCCPDINNPQIAPPVRNSCNSFTFTGTSPNQTGAPITWSFGNIATLPGISGVPITYTFPPETIPGDYCVKFCVGSPSINPTNCTGNCTATSVRVPIRAFFTYKLGCNGCLNIINLSKVLPTSGSAVASYSWDFGDGSPVVTTPSAIPPAHCYTATNSTNYTVTLTINYTDPSLGLTCQNQYSVSFNYTPLAISVNPSPVCTGVSATFNIVGSPSFNIITSAWNFGDGFTAYTIPTTHIYNTASNFPVTLTVTDALGITCKDSSNINVLPGISNCTIVPAFICPGTAATLTALNIAGATYLWEVETTPGNFVSAPGTNNAMTYSTTAPGFYRVIITSSNGCKCISNKVEVKAVTKPKAIIGATPSSKICGSGNIFLTSTNQLPGYTSQWYANGNYGTPLGGGQVYLASGVSVTTVFNLILTNEYGCKDTCSFTITVNPIPAQPLITNSPTLCEGVLITLNVTNYTNNITWNTGANTTSSVVYAAGVYTATYTNPLTGCSSSKNIKINRRPPTDLFPHFCEKIPCTCRDSLGNFTIYAPKPLIGTFASNYNIQWYFNNNLVGTNGNNPLYTPAVNGTYHVVITDPLTGCKDTSDKYSIVVLPCDTCGCKESQWGAITLNKKDKLPVTGIEVNPKSSAGTGIINGEVLQCNGGYTLKCNQTYTINANYICKDSSCPSKVTYSLQPPSGSPITGNGPFSFIPNQSGAYTLVLYGWCGNQICDSCKITFKVECKPECNCKGSRWGDKFYTIDNVTKPITCMKPSDKPIDVKCKSPITITAGFYCGFPNICPPKLTYTLQQPTGSPIIGTLPLTFTPNQTGTYSITLYGWCGTKICDSCVIRFKTECDSVTCCPYQIKADTTPVKYNYVLIPNATVVTENFTISGLSTASITEVRANIVSYTITDNFNQECMKCVNLPFTWGSVSSATNIGNVPPKITLFGGATVSTFIGSGAGAYQNPREIVWNNNTTISIPNNTNIGINFIVPPPSGIDCCELKGKICVKFTFRDNDCKECEVIKCFEFKIKKK